MRPYRALTLSLLALLVTLVAAPAATGSEQVDQLISWMTGTFDSGEQAGRDPDFLDIRVVTVQVPRSRLGASVLYVEQAASSAPHAPYRQRFHRVEDAGPGRVFIRVYEPKDPIALAGKWREPADLAVFGLSDVLERPGCLLILRRDGDHFSGGTEGLGCPSSRGGARYSTSTATIFPGRMETADRGFDAQDKQVWGPTKGSYVFVRRSQEPPPVLEARSVAAPTPIPVQMSRTPDGSIAPVYRETVPRDTGRPAAGYDSLVVSGDLRERTYTIADLRALPQSAVIEKQPDGEEKRPAASHRGVQLAELLRRAGVETEGMSALRILAPAILVAQASDGYTVAFAAEELLVPGKSPILVFEENGRPLGPEKGPFRIVFPASRVRSLRQVVSLDFRLLGRNPATESGDLTR